MKKEWLAYFFVLILTIISAGCNKEKDHSADAGFCAFISQKNFNGTGSLINTFLKGQSATLTEHQKLEQLKDWMKSMSCVADVEILCTSCIYTLPAQSELKVTFVIDGKLSENVFDIIMDNPLRFGTYHIQ